MQMRLPLPGRAFLVVSLILLVASCKPSVQQCASIMPAGSENVVPAQTPAGTNGCRGTIGGVPVTVEAKRSGLEWTRGRIWVGTVEVAEANLPDALREERIRLKIENAGESVRGVIRGIAKGVSDAVDDAKTKP